MMVNGHAYPEPPKEPYRLISFIAFIALIALVVIMVLSSCKAVEPVDYSYTQDSRDSIIARVHHYEVTVKPDRNLKGERNATILLFILMSLIVFLTL